MTIHEHKTTILSWIRSCHTNEQLELVREAVEQFITKRFADAPELNNVQKDLEVSIKKKEIEISLPPTPSVIAPTLERNSHLNDIT